MSTTEEQTTKQDVEWEVGDLSYDEFQDVVDDTDEIADQRTRFAIRLPHGTLVLTSRDLSQSWSDYELLTQLGDALGLAEHQNPFAPTASFIPAGEHAGTRTYMESDGFQLLINLATAAHVNIDGAPVANAIKAEWS